jgi:FMN phosphatase YigB (HAD superfamily)
MTDPAEGAPRAVLFDLDDTLVPFQSVAHWQWAWKPQGPILSERHARAAIRRSVRAWDRRRWQGLVGSAPPAGPAELRLHLHDTLIAVAGRPLADAEIESVVDRFLRPSPHSETYPDVPGAIAWLRAEGIPFGVVTPLPEDVARAFLSRTAAGAEARLFADPGTPDAPRLPSAAAFRTARSAIAPPGARVVYVGNLYWSDVRAATRAGLEAVLLDRLEMFEGLGGARIENLGALRTLFEAAPAPVAPSEPSVGP